MSKNVDLLITLHDGCVFYPQTTSFPLGGPLCVVCVRQSYTVDFPRVVTCYASQVIKAIQTSISSEKFKVNTCSKSSVHPCTALEECCSCGIIYPRGNSSSIWHVRPLSTIKIRQESLPVDGILTTAPLQFSS